MIDYQNKLCVAVVLVWAFILIGVEVPEGSIKQQAPNHKQYRNTNF